MRARTRLPYSILIAVLCTAALVAVIILLSGELGETDARVVGAAFGIVVFAAMSLAGFSLRRRARTPVLAYACIAVSAVGFLAWMILIFSDNGFETEGIWKPSAALFIVAVAAAQGSLLILGGRYPEGRLVQAVVVAALAMIAVFAALLVIAVLEQVQDLAYYRYTGAVAVLWAWATILPPILRRAHEHRVERPGKAP